MSKLEPGMLALVVGCRSNPRHIGKVVTIEKHIPHGDVVFMDDSKFYAITHPGHDGFVCSGDVAYDETCQYGAFDRNHLMPLQPLSDPLETKQEQELHA